MRRVILHEGSEIYAPMCSEHGDSETNIRKDGQAECRACLEMCIRGVGSDWRWDLTAREWHEMREPERLKKRLEELRSETGRMGGGA